MVILPFLKPSLGVSLGGYMFQFNDFDIQQQVLAFMLQNGIVPFDDNLHLPRLNSELMP